jgi:hypothetical protein
MTSAPDLYDTLNCAATAIDEAGSGRPALARDARREAGIAAARAAARHTRLATALTNILLAVELDSTRASTPRRSALWTALDGASLAVLKAGDGLDGAVGPLLDATFAANTLPSAERRAFRVILDAIAVIAAGENAVTS